MKIGDHLKRRMADFARNHILTRSGLGIDTDFPEEIWTEMGAAGLMDPGCLEKERPCRSIAAGAHTMVAAGGNLGLALSWMIHQMTARYMVQPNLPGLPNKLWDKVSTGEATVSFAVSEPNVGAHPKFMSASAEKKAGGWSLSGEKAYLTNGPIATHFIVIAITGCGQDGKKSFSAFLVPRGTPGLSPCVPMEIPFFKPAPHGNILLKGCLLAPDWILGREGRAFEDLVLPFRKLEDAAMTGAVSGAMAFILPRAAQTLAGAEPEPSRLEILGDLGATAESAAWLSDRIAAMADQGDPGLESLVLFFRQTAARFLGDLKLFLADGGIRLEGRAGILFRDLASSAKIGSTVSGIKKQKLGRRMWEEVSKP